MRRLLFAAAILALLFPAGQRAEARTDISIDFFYDNLGDGGAWVEVADYGFCWQPTVAVSNRSWRPYSDGYWAYTDVGWTWVSYEDFGWATYHYGRWIRLRGRGWVWVPGREWGPAWVSWRTGGDYVGWAPLPPRRAGEYWDESPITARVDIDFDIGPAYYNFIEVRYIGEPLVRERIFAPEQNVTYITKTVNVTNITYTNSTVYNYGPDYNTLSRYSDRPIQRLSLQRETNVDPATAAQSKSLMKVQGDKLVIAAPQQFQKPAKTVAPKVVKEKIAQTNVERGWEPVSDPKARAELKEKIKKEDPKTVPPPTTQPSEKTAASPATSPSGPTTTTTPVTTTSPAAAPSASPMTSAPPAPTMSASPSTPKEKDKKDKNKRPDTVSPTPNASASVSPGTTPATTPDKKNKRNEKTPPSVAPSVSAPPASVPPATTPVPPAREKAKDKQRDKVAPSASVPPSSTTGTTAPSAPPKPPKEKSEKRKNEPRPNAAPPAPMESAPRTIPPPVTKPESEKPKQEAPPPDSAPKTKKEPPQERAVPPAPANPPGRDDGKKQKKNEPAASPTP